MSLLSEEESISGGASISWAHRVKVLRQRDLVHIVSAHSIHFSRCSRCHLRTHSKALMLRRLWARRLQSAHAWRMSLRLVCVSYQVANSKKQDLCM